MLIAVVCPPSELSETPFHFGSGNIHYPYMPTLIVLNAGSLMMFKFSPLTIYSEQSFGMCAVPVLSNMLGPVASDFFYFIIQTVVGKPDILLIILCFKKSDCITPT